MNRLFHIDLARVIAIFLVTAYHLSRAFPVDAQVGSFDLYGVFRHGYIGVDVFFVISGYVMALTWERQAGNFASGSRSFLRSRLLRLMPAYVIAIVFWVTVIVSTGYAQKPVGLFHILSHLTFTHTLFPSSFFSVSGVMWSLAVEVHFYLLFPLLASLTWRQRFWVLGFCALVSLGVTVVVPESHWLMYPLRWNVVTFLPLFMLGVFIYERHDENGRDLTWLFWPLIAGSVAVMLLVKPFDTNVFARLLLGGALGFALVATSPFRSGELGLGKAISLVAAASYSIYLYNYVMLFLVDRVFGVAAMLVGMVFIFAFGVGMWWLFDRNFEKVRHRYKARLLRRLA
ncbi:acyltransferase [Agrobacterium sp. SOY23]|uniref:acyltransferase family protein n=1 Tax=Agrobacterium sp. SOY23 TaxID=3014555 RepID=UPI0022AFAD7E|nr:acyltransferase [Agrobacterium sp. SOY23]MCZ4430318.1 acyltransferase [Agrobacterium sp. SOY23]